MLASKGSICECAESTALFCDRYLGTALPGLHYPRGSLSAITTLVSCTSEGEGVPQDYVQALKWYRLAAAQGDALAQYNLGVMYAKGQGVPQDYAEGLEVVSPRRCSRGCPAQYNLGVMYIRETASRRTMSKPTNGSTLLRQPTPKKKTVTEQ